MTHPSPRSEENGAAVAAESDAAAPGGRSGRRARGGSGSRRATRRGGARDLQKQILRKIPYFEVMNSEALEIIEENAETVLEEVGLEFRGDAEALELWKEAGCDVNGEREHVPRGLCRTLATEDEPQTFIQHARNPEGSVQIGGDVTVFAPVYGPPFVSDLEGGRRYGTIEDFNNFVKLAYMAPAMHHSGGTVCEPVDVPVNKRHLDMLYAHMRYSDKAFMGSVTAPERAKDSVAMAKILFGEDFVEQNTVMISLINANSPMVWDDTMVGALKTSGRHIYTAVSRPFHMASAAPRRRIDETMRP